MSSKKSRPRDSEATRRAALDAAQRLFAEKGFAGTSMREIASASGVSQPLIHYHFGNKEGLYRALKERWMKESRRKILPTLEGSPDGPVDLSGVVRATYEFVSGNEDLMRLVAWSHLERESTPWPGEEELTRALTRHIQQHLCDLRPEKRIDPLIATIMLEALILHWSQHRRYFAGLFDEPLENVTHRYLDEVARLFFVRPGAHDNEE